MISREGLVGQAAELGGSAPTNSTVTVVPAPLNSHRVSFRSLPSGVCLFPARAGPFLPVTYLPDDMVDSPLMLPRAAE